MSCSGSYQTSALRPDEAARLQAVMGLTLQEVCAAKWVFTLLDLDNDGEGALGRRRGGEGGRVYVWGRWTRHTATAGHVRWGRSWEC